MNAAAWLMVVSIAVMALLAGFIVWINRKVQEQQRERYFDDIRHVRIPDDTGALTKRRHKPKPPYRPF